MAVNTLTATGKTVASPVLGSSPLLKTLPPANLSIQSPSVGQASLLKLLVPVGKTVAVPVFGSALFQGYIVSVGMSAGSPVFSSTMAKLRLVFPTPVNTVAGRPVLGSLPIFFRQTLVATGKTVAIPVFGQPLLLRYQFSPISLSVGALFFTNPQLFSALFKVLPNAVSLWTVPVTFGQPTITHIPNFIVPPLRIGSPYFSDPNIYTNYPYGGDMRGLPAEPGRATPYYREVNAIWPDLLNQRAVISPARNGVNRVNGQLLQGWEHVEQSMQVIFATPFHERILRRWVGSYVPYILGETYVARVVTRFFWAIAVSIDLWEPNYRIKQVFYMGEALRGYSPQMLDAVGEFRLGHAIFRTEGVYRPRAHLGDASPYQQRAIALVGRGTEYWDPAIAPPPGG